MPQPIIAIVALAIITIAINRSGYRDAKDTCENIW